MSLSRRQFLQVSAGTAAAAAIGDQALALAAQQPVIKEEELFAVLEFGGTVNRTVTVP